MNFMLFIFLSGVFLSGISYVIPNNKESDMVPINDEENKEEEIKDTVPGNEKNDHHYKDTKQYVFTTQSPNGTQSEISVRATTDLKFSLRNYKLNETTTLPPGNSNEELSKKRLQKSTQGPNEPAFWTMLAKALNETTENEEAKDQLFQPIPSSDLNATNEEKEVGPQDIKLKLMLGISLMTLCLFVILLAVSSSLLYKLKTSFIKKQEREYTVNPELAALSYFHPAEGVSDTSFSKSAGSSTYLDTKSKSKTTDMISTASDEDE